jgi:hypothetical protein
MAVRSNYIKKMMEAKNSLDKQYEEVVKESMKSIIGENAKKEIRELLKESEEDEDSFEVEDVVDDVPSTETGEGESGEAAENVAAEEGDIWDDLEKCKGENGEYDCTGMDNEKLLKIVQSMGPEDGIRVVSNGDGTATVEVDGDAIDGEAEYVIDIEEPDVEDFDDGVEDLDEPEEDEDVIDLDIDLDDDDDIEECNVRMNESDNTGYTDNYQKKTAMTTPDNHEPADPKTTYSMDAGVPKGTKKPWAQDGDIQPYNESEEKIEEGSHTVTQNNSNVRGVTRSFPTNSSSQETDRNGAPEGESPTTGKGRKTSDGYKPSNESFERKMNEIYNENKQMKALIPQLQERINESMIINASMGYIVRILNENATTSDEKAEISKRFSKVTSLDECKKLYNQITSELNSGNKKINDFGNMMNEQIAKGNQKQALVEKTMYRSEKVNQTLDFMKRLNAIK